MKKWWHVDLKSQRKNSSQPRSGPRCAVRWNEATDGFPSALLRPRWFLLDWTYAALPHGTFSGANWKYIFVRSKSFPMSGLNPVTLDIYGLDAHFIFVGASELQDLNQNDKYKKKNIFNNYVNVLWTILFLFYFAYTLNMVGITHKCI